MKPVQQESTDVKGKPRRKERAFDNKSRLYSMSAIVNNCQSGKAEC